MSRAHPSSFSILHVQDQVAEISSEQLEKAQLTKDVMYPWKGKCKFWVVKKWIIFRESRLRAYFVTHITRRLSGC